MYTELMKCTSRAMGPRRQRHIEWLCNIQLCCTQLCCLSECIGSAVHFWNSHSQKHAVKWKTKEADFLPWKAEIPLSCNREQRQCPWPTPWASQRNGKWQRRETTIPQGHQESCSTGGPCSENLEQPPELPLCSGAPILDEVFSCRCLLHLNIFCGDHSCPFHTEMKILPLFLSEEVGLLFSLSICCWRIDSSNHCRWSPLHGCVISKQ